LAAGDAFGSNLFNLMIIGLLDFFWRDGPLLNRVSFTAALIGALGILLMGIAAVGIFVHQESTFGTGLSLSPMSLLLLVSFIVSMLILYRADQSSVDSEVEDEPSQSLQRAFSIYGISAVVVLVAAVWLAFVGDSLAVELGLERSFIGTQFLALSTSLPELAASIAAIRLGAPELAISNLLGSNLFNMGFVLFVDDALYIDGPIWEVVASVHVFTALAGILMTAVVIIALMAQERGRPGRLFTFEALMLVALYLGVSALVYQLA
jgi:cation:H+ antiporter